MMMSRNETKKKKTYIFRKQVNAIFEFIFLSIQKIYRNI